MYSFQAMLAPKYSSMNRVSLSSSLLMSLYHLCCSIPSTLCVLIEQYALESTHACSIQF